MLSKLDGVKTYIGMIGIGVMGIMYAWGAIGDTGWISSEVGATIASLLTAWTGIAMRSAVQKSGPAK
jgi:hypothetical protein